MEYSNDLLVAQATDVEKVTFYKKTYTHLALAVLAFVVVESLLISVVPEETIISMISQKYIWLLILGGFWLASILANKWTLSQNKSTQYMGLGFYVLLQAIIFLPMIYIAMFYSDPTLIPQAAIITLALFGGLTGVAFTSKRDFSFLRNIIVVGGFVALGLIIAGALFGFNLGLWFSVGMVLLASASILYETQKLQFTYTKGQYVGASLQLFASVMLLFWYVLRILMSRRD
ncbi:Bax inhibitor-1/YccA family protein [Riemerella anatipestifer]|uniref:Bax inhibitor-1/YccA family protein n=1 Tax=Riemerella anatipestifer TaxID=34085 RepID=UPI00129E0D36|nr:Bax inhibitor-1 family protein [Riemerella anatipestifer]MBT0550785.1 Bax inhibitor-1/YccA family protein [Riemerella anatipestifer]MBT0553511.1 Bax inhibitor-1/YccA family protein [Riemerella anatipestifer]MCE3024318.1 Bax inhibitor-1 family protein [Riemerella anatipestifer]MCU7541936.1 Bax inhibitor-1 family protein [Riemerella anatipestifer]MCU7559049.1 Bax inhibitor-1 family protein [Riemerella anatipestifer]